MIIPDHAAAHLRAKLAEYEQAEQTYQWTRRDLIGVHIVAYLGSYLAPESEGGEGEVLATLRGCTACRVMGPLLIAPGTSGRSWRCGTCGEVWEGSYLMPELEGGKDVAAPAGSARGDEGTPAGASVERTWCSSCERTYRLEQPGHSCPMCAWPLTETPTLRAAMDRQPQQRR